jgi:hypothetical protein
MVVVSQSKCYKERAAAATVQGTSPRPPNEPTWMDLIGLLAEAIMDNIVHFPPDLEVLHELL